MADQDPAALAREALNLCSTGPQPGESTTIGECNQGTEWSSTCLRWRHIRNGEAVKDEQYDEDAPKGHSTEADFHIFARDNLATLARSVLALTEERDALRRTLSSARASIRLVLNRDKISEWTAGALREAETEIDAALRGKEGT